MLSAKLIETIQVQNTLGEGVTWRESDQTCWWVDIEEKLLFRLEWPSVNLTTFEMPLKVSAIGFVKGNDNQIVVATEDGFGLYQPGENHVKLFDRPHGLKKNMRLNDGRVDANGRFWAGSMYDGNASENKHPSGYLYRLEPDGTATPVISSLSIPNGLAWSPDSHFMYVTDSESHTVSRARFDEKLGLPGVFAPLTKFNDVYPDGAIVDTMGGYWCALWGGGKVVRLDASGRVTLEISVPAKQVTCCAFGGEKHNLLFITSARHGLKGDVLDAFPDSGNVFIYETAFHGLNTARVRLEF